MEVLHKGYFLFDSRTKSNPFSMFLQKWLCSHLFCTGALIFGVKPYLNRNLVWLFLERDAEQNGGMCVFVDLYSVSFINNLKKNKLGRVHCCIHPVSLLSEWHKTVILALSSGECNLQTLIFG